MKLTKKQQEFIKEIYKDEDGVLCILRSDYGHGVDDNGVIHCETYSELKRELKDVSKL